MASGGFTFGSPGEGFFRVEAGIASPGLTSDFAKAGWFASVSAIWTPGRAASIGRRRAGEILDEPPAAEVTECDVLSAAVDLPPASLDPSAPASPRNVLATPPPPSATAASPSPAAPKPGGRPCLTPRQTDIYVDFFVKADYQLDRGTQPGTGSSSTLLHLTFADGTEIDVDFREIDEDTVDTPTFRRQVHDARVGAGHRLFPERMNRRTTPRLWAEKHKALAIIDEETLGFIDLGLTGVMTVLPIPAGGLRPAPGSAGSKSRVRSATGPTASSPKPRAGAGQPAPEPRAVTPDELQIHVAPDREPPGGAVGGSRGGKPPGRLSVSQRLANMRNGQKYDAAHKFDYERREVYIDRPGGGNPYRLDGYIHGREIVSRKLVQFARVTLKTAFGYLKEVPKKYLPGRFISKVPSNGPLAGKPLDGKMYLEVPVQTEPVPRAVLEKAAELKVIIRDVMGKEYN
jgi:hypothetical protein